MSSILTNTSAMVALQTLKSVNAGLAQTQNEISTGKTVASAKDNAAVWAISKVMESDVIGFKGISDSLSLGASTVAVARKASETVTGLLQQMKGKIVAAQESNVDRGKLQTDVEALRDQIKAVVGAAQFNGLNLVNGSTTTTDILASLDRSGAGVAASSISVAGQDLSIGGYVAKAAFTGTTGASTDGDAVGSTIDRSGGTFALVVDAAGGYAVGDRLSVTIGGKTASYTSTVAGETEANMATGLRDAILSMGIADLDVSITTAGTIDFVNDTGADMSVSAQFKNASAGDLGKLETMDVSTTVNARTALADIETMLQTSIDAAAAFGSAEKRIGIQKEFVSSLVDSLKTGIGAMVDADMEEASARLQALQVQQQLGIQSLSIANQAPQSILSLFR